MDGVKYMAKSMFDIIKKQNGEKFAKEIRDTDSRIFEIENLPEILKYAGRNPENLVPFLRGLLKVEEDVQTSEGEDPFTLLKQAGYNAFYANTLQKQNSIQKYFKKSEELCTFRDPDRYKDYYIIHAVKENVDQIRREDFPYPERQDAYGTSVISIQIIKEGGFVSIKNRYNHSVLMADATFESNPDNIINGLSVSLKKYFNVDFKTSSVAKLPDGFTYQNGCLYKYNDELNNYYFGDGFYLKDGVVTELKKDYQFFVGHYLFDLKEKTVKSLGYKNDPYVQIMNEEMADKKIQKRVVDGSIHLYLNSELFFKTKKEFNIDYIDEITLSKARELPDGDVCGKLFENVSVIRAPKVRKIGSNCLCRVDFFDLPKLEETGNSCFSYRYIKGMDKIYLPHLRKIGNKCFSNISAVKEIILPELLEAGDVTFNGTSCSTLLLPKLERIGSKGIAFNKNLTKLVAPCLKSMGQLCVVKDNALENLYLPTLERMGEKCIVNNKNLKKVFVPQLKKVFEESFYGNKFACYIEAPNLNIVGYGSLDNWARLYAPKVKDFSFTRNQFYKKMIQAYQAIKKAEKRFDLMALVRSYYKSERQIG